MSRQDFLVVLAWFVDTIAQGLLPLDPLMLRLLRLVKLQLGEIPDGQGLSATKNP
jgi:hypothetical protein